MNILFISAVLPYPLYSGGQVRIYNLLKQLSKKHSITVFSFIRNEEEKKYLKELSFVKKTQVFMRGSAWQPKYIIRSLTSRLPLLMASYEHKEMKCALSDELKNNTYDCIHIEPFYVFPVLPLYGSIPLVVGEHNIEYEVFTSYVDQQAPFLRPFLRADVKKIKKQEEQVWQNATKITTVSPYDAGVIQNVTNPEKVCVVPNGVDTEEFVFTKKTFTGVTKHILFVGNFKWIPNMKAVETLLCDIWPVIKKEMADLKLTVIGNHLSQSLQKRITVLGETYEPYIDDIRDAYKKADILLAPMTISGGTKFKVLEAMAAGCLVLTTKEGVAGIDVQAGKHFFEIQTPASVVETLRTVYGNPQRAQRVAKEARKRIEATYAWTTISKKLSEVWTRAL